MIRAARPTREMAAAQVKREAHPATGPATRPWSFWARYRAATGPATGAATGAEFEWYRPKFEWDRPKFSPCAASLVVLGAVSNRAATGPATGPAPAPDGNA